MRNRVIAGIAAVALVASLSPAAAFASGAEPLQTGQMTTQTSAVSTQAAKATVWVVKKIGSETFSYNKNGLVTKRSNSYETKRYAYSGTRLKSFTTKLKSGGSTKVALSYKKGRVSQVKSSGTASYMSYVGKFTYNKKSRVSKIVQQYGSGTKTTEKYAYDSKGRVKQAVNTNGTKITYGYDSHGNAAEFSAGPSKGYGFTRYIFNSYTYKNGRIAKRSQTMNGTGGAVSTASYSYKKMRVPKSCVSKIKKQQRVLVGNADPATVL